MQVEFVFELRNQLMLAEGLWPPLEFCRKEFSVQIQKPELCSIPFIRLDAQKTDIGRFRFDPGLAVVLPIANIRIVLDLGRVVERSEVQRVFQDLALSLFAELKSWIRVLARQYWVGLKQSFLVEQHFNVNLITPGGKEPVSNAGDGLGYEYWKIIDAGRWQEIGKRLATDERPRPGQLLFCSGLLEMSEANLSQAVIAFGASCEIELLAILQRAKRVLIESNKPVPDNIQRAEHARFADRLKSVENLVGTRFAHHNPNSDRLIRELYKLRNDAIHCSRLSIEDTSVSAPANAAKLLQYVGACEHFFAWLDSKSIA